MKAEFNVRTPLRLGAYVDHIIFPCSRTLLVFCAEENDAPDSILDAIETLPELMYSSIEDIIAKFQEPMGHGRAIPTA